MKHLFVFLLVVCCFACAQNSNIRLVEVPEKEKIEVYIDDRLFTSFMYSDTLRKQILYPVYTASGESVTRGFPLDPQPGERTDHPHHIGLWFNFGDVNGLDFWNNSYQVPEEKRCNYGTIFCTKITKVNRQSGEIGYEADWVDCNRNVLLKEATTYIFEGKPNLRSIVRKTILTADKEVCLTENKEGLFAMRMDRNFEEEQSGVYLNKEGVTKGDVWGKRSPWVSLSGRKNEEDISVVIIDHPSNSNYPAWWHARGYGLFAINNLGGSVFDKEVEKVVINMRKGEHLTFTYKVLIKNGGFITEEEINKETNF